MMGRRPAPLPTSTHQGLLRLAGEISAMTLNPGLNRLRLALVEALTAISAREEGVEEQASKAIRACRRFHEGIWLLLTDQHGEMLEAAAAELDALRSVLRENAWQAAVEEVARDRLRARFPLISAQEVWDRLSQPAAS